MNRIMTQIKDRKDLSPKIFVKHFVYNGISISKKWVYVIEKIVTISIFLHDAKAGYNIFLFSRDLI